MLASFPIWSQSKTMIDVSVEEISRPRNILFPSLRDHKKLKEMF